MAKFFNCLARLREAAGRDLSDDEVQDIFERINRVANDLKAGRTDPGSYESKRPKLGAALDQVINTVAEEAARQKIAEANRAERNAALQIVKLGQRADDVAAIEQAGISKLDSVGRIIANKADGRADAFSLENRYLGIDADMKRRLTATWDAMGPDFLGFLQNPEKIKLLVREMRGEATGDALAKKGAEAWLAMAEDFRTRFNDGGGTIGKLEDWGMPQHHSQELVARAGKDAWIDYITPLLDRSRYVDDAGRAWTDPELRTFLEHAWNTISTNGYANIIPGEFRGTGAVSNRHAEPRVIHFDSADALIAYWQKFGDRTFPDILMRHVDSMAKDIAMVEHFGPNPDAAFRTLRDQAMKDQALEDPTKLTTVDKQVTRLNGLWDVASGRTAPIANATIAHVFDTMRNLNVAGKLGSAFWASFFGDKVMLETMSRMNNLPMLQNWYNELRLLNPANPGERRVLQRQGLMLDYMRNAMARWGDDLGQNSLTGRLANAVMRASGMNAINEWRRGSFGLTLMSSLGHEVGTKEFTQVNPQDMHLLANYGINARDWAVWRLAQLEDYGHGNTTMLTPDAITAIPDASIKAALGEGENVVDVKREAVTKLLGVVASESRLAVIEPGWRQRAQIATQIPRGEIRGELLRSFWQFKTFPLTQFERMIEVAWSKPSFGGKIGVLSTVMAMQALAGAMIVTTRDVLSGKDPREVDWKFGLQAFLQGGALGIYGDFLYGVNQTRYGTGPLEIAAGPTIGSALDVLTSTLQAGKDATEGKQTHLLAKYMTIAKGFIPANNLWYTKAATDHLIFQNIQEALNPGYLASMRARSMREYHQSWWWEPGESAPSRPPNIEAALGR